MMNYSQKRLLSVVGPKRKKLRLYMLASGAASCLISIAEIMLELHR